LPAFSGDVRGASRIFDGSDLRTGEIIFCADVCHDGTADALPKNSAPVATTAPSRTQ
jgi:hypothetical protein